jgi:hypothetical protein
VPKRNPLRTPLVITESEIRSARTRHTATAWPVPGEPTLWSVTWLPGRALTQSQAVTAMTLAQAIAAHGVIADPLHAGHPLWAHLDQWAAELGLSGPAALARASMSPEDHDRAREAPEPGGLYRDRQADAPCPEAGL